jgi:hypothetical protein
MMTVGLRKSALILNVSQGLINMNANKFHASDVPRDKSSLTHPRGETRSTDETLGYLHQSNFASTWQTFSTRNIGRLKCKVRLSS